MWPCRATAGIGLAPVAHPSASGGGRWVVLLRVVVLASTMPLMLPGAWGHSVTPVEFAMLPSGLATWQRSSLGIYRVCGPVSKLTLALPAYLAGVRVDYPPAFDADIETRREWTLGRAFQEQAGIRYHTIYQWSRLTSIFLTLLGGCLICEWATRLYGRGAGLVSLCAWCWMPPVLGHGALLTSDMPSVVILLCASRIFWSFLIWPGPVRAALAGVFLGLAIATKFTLLILSPWWAFLLTMRVLDSEGAAPLGRQRIISSARLVAWAMLMFLTGIITVNALYFFQEFGFRLSATRFMRSSFAVEMYRLAGVPGLSWLAHVSLPIPLEFVRGLNAQLADVEQAHSAYLLGRTRFNGWSLWYLAAFLIKIPLPVLVLLVMATSSWLGSERRGSYQHWATLCLLGPAAEIALAIGMTTGTGTNAAFRYLLPSIALMCVWAGRAWIEGPRFVRSVVIALLSWLCVGTAVGLPDHIGWRNELGWAWEKWNGRPAVVGDSLDWSQDLIRLRGWIDRHACDGSTIVCVYGLGRGTPYGLDVPLSRPASQSWRESVYLAVSENILFGYEVNNTVIIAGGLSWLNDDQRSALANRLPFDRVGRTICIYRVSDLLEDPTFREVVN